MASRLSLFLAELKRRKVTRTAVAYAVVGLGLIEAANNILPNLGLESITAPLIILVLIGFPVTLLVSWVFDFSKEGWKRTPDIPEADVAVPEKGGWKNFPWRLLVISAAVLLVVGFGANSVMEASRLRWVMNDALPEITRLLDEDRTFDAWLLAEEVEDLDPGNPSLESMRPRLARTVDIRTDPPGARVMIRDYLSDDSGWRYLGPTPIEDVSLPYTYLRIRLEKEGFESIDGAGRPSFLNRQIALDSVGSFPEGMVQVPGGSRNLRLLGLEDVEPIEIGGYFIDRNEVSNREYQVFVDAGGYEQREFWRFPFREGEESLSWQAAIGRLTDRTGRPGPATWEAGHFPAGREDYPVTGVSWYEAAAYAAFMGKDLPTVYHWAYAADPWASGWIVPKSNLMGTELLPRQEGRGLGPYGTSDMAGNVREWCFNETNGDRYILGGGWNDPAYGLNGAYAQQPLDRSEINGIRLVTYTDSTGLAEALQPLERPFRDFDAEPPVSDEVFEVFLGLYDYDRVPLEAVVEAADSTMEDRIWERVSFNGAYGERLPGYLYLPRVGQPPFQTVIYFPGSGSLHRRDSSGLGTTQSYHIQFLLNSGRAVFWPIYKSTYERGDSLQTDYPNESNFYKEHVIMWAKDVRRSIDYLETRPEIDSTKIAYFGSSWGGLHGLLIPAVEPRIKVAISVVAGLLVQRGQPEVEPIHYLPRIKIPFLLLNGEFDHYFPKEHAQRPAFERLGTASEDKRWVAYPGGHSIPRAALIRESLDWLDRYFGPVTR
ncbi:MAG: SUMF1/EgtB/PvdO family nonheme iron enzyme [Gemmatimonadota bacterium]